MTTRRLSLRRLAGGPILAGLVLASAASAVLAPSAAAGPGRSHPHFDDRGTLTWYVSLGEAQQAAQASGKLIFIDYGRLACGNCRTLVSRVLPDPAVRQRIGAVAVGLAADCDRSDPQVEGIFARGLGGSAIMLPFVALVTPDLRWVTGWSGSIDAAGVSRHLALCEPHVRRGAPAATAPASKPAPTSAPTKRGPAPAATAPAAKPTPPPARCEPTPAPAGADFGSDCEMECKDGSCCLKRKTGTPPAPVPSERAPEALAAAPAPRAATAPSKEPVAKAPPSRVTPAEPAPRPAAAPAPRLPVPEPVAPAAAAAEDESDTPLERARAASEAGRYGEVIRIGNEAESAPATTDSWELDLLVRKARSWALDGMNAAVADAKKGDYDAAAKSLERVRVAMAGLPVEIDAERGQRALLRLADVARGSPDSPESPETMRKAAYAEFRGTRWAVLFKDPR